MSFNKKSTNKGKQSVIDKQFHTEMRKPFTFEGYLKDFWKNEKLYSELFLGKLRNGFCPSDEVVNKIMSSNNERYGDIKRFLGSRQMSASKQVV